MLQEDSSQRIVPTLEFSQPSVVITLVELFSSGVAIKSYLILQAITPQVPVLAVASKNQRFDSSQWILDDRQTYISI